MKRVIKNLPVKILDRERLRLDSEVKAFGERVGERNE